MRSVFSFAKAWYADAFDPLRRADPLLMGAAFAYNSLFALVPLAIAFVSILTFFEFTHDVLDDLIVAMQERLPEEVSDFLIQIIDESVGAVEDSRWLIVFITVPIALWSGSRAVYTIQKALRLVSNSEVEMGYLRMRGIGILVTIAGGVGILFAYFFLLFGGQVTGVIVGELGRFDQLFGTLLSGSAAFLWMFALLYAIYRWGGPVPVPRTAMSSAIVVSIIIAGTYFLVRLIPTQAPASLAVFGAIGLTLLWLYLIGIVVVGVPIAVGSVLNVMDEDQVL